MTKERDFNPLDLSGRKILVTGASSGIGRATAVYLARLGAQLVLTGRDKERTTATLGQLEGNDHSAITADLSEPDDVGALYDQAVGDGVKLRGLVHCAGVSCVMPLGNLTRKRLMDSFSINYFAFIELVRQYSKPKYSDGGSIVGISSIAAEQAEQCQTAYSAAKAAMDISSQALAFELIKKGIRINTVLPGAIKTEIVQQTADLGVDTERVGKAQLMGLGRPDDVAAVCAFLVSDMSRFITGRRLFVDGGRFL